MIKALVTFGLVVSANTAMAIGISATLHDMAEVVNAGATRINSVVFDEQDVADYRANSHGEKITKNPSLVGNGEWMFHKTNAYAGKPFVPLDKAHLLLPEGLKLTDLEKKQLTGVGAIACADGSVKSGFLIDPASISGWKETKPILATGAHALYDRLTGYSRGVCTFYANGDIENGVIIEESIVGGAKLSKVDPNDWAFARLSKPLPGAGSIVIEFKDEYDFDLPDEANARFLSSQFVLKNSHFKIDKKMALAVNCKPETKIGFLPPDNEYDSDYRKMMIHHCGLIEYGSGSVLAKRTPYGLRALGINLGDSGEGTNMRSEVNAVFNGTTNFNYSRRFDNELKEKLTEFVGASSE